MPGLEHASGELTLTLLLSGLALLGVWLPLQRGIRVCWQAGAATRRVPRSQLEAASGAARPDASLALLMVRVLRQSARECPDQPREFLLDATKQYVINEWESHYARLISMYANLLPPIGFIGTTGGMLVLFLSRHLASASLELGALALALTSSIFALMGFAALEALKIRLYARLLLCLNDVVAAARIPARAAAPSAHRSGLERPLPAGR